MIEILLSIPHIFFARHMPQKQTVAIEQAALIMAQSAALLTQNQLNAAYREVCFEQAKTPTNK